MKKMSALSRRALAITAAVLLVTVAVMMAGTLLLARHSARGAAKSRLLRATQYAADNSGGAAPSETVLQALAADYGEGALEWGVVDLARDPASVPGRPAGAEAFLDAAWQGYAQAAILRDEKGGSYVYAAAPLWEGGILPGLLVTRTPAPGIGGPLFALLVSLAAGLALSVPLLIVSVRRRIGPTGRQVESLKDVAVRVSGGDFDAKADESMPGELGELGQALNNLSSQLARNMYMLILERNRLKHMLDGLGEGVVAVDHEGKVTHRNPALERMFSLAAKAVGMDARMRLIPDKTIWEDFDKVITTGTAITRNIEMPDMTLRLVISPIVDEIGVNAGAVGLFTDITQMERLERTRRDYVANVSHEMRTPLTAMRALVEPLKEGMVTKEEDRLRYYDIILREILRLSRLISDLMELSRLQSGTLSIQTRPMLLEDLVLDICDRYNSIAEDHGLTFGVDSDFSKCPPVVGNADRIEQLLVILLDNAIKYTPTGGRIAVSASWDDRRVVLSVSDTGIGIAPEDLPYVFDRFYKVDKAHSGMGSGLGLSIARELLKWMNEDIWVRSEKGKGTTFSFTVRRALAREEKAEA